MNAGQVTVSDHAWGRWLPYLSVTVTLRWIVTVWGIGYKFDPDAV